MVAVSDARGRFRVSAAFEKLFASTIRTKVDQASLSENLWRPSMPWAYRIDAPPFAIANAFVQAPY